MTTRKLGRAEAAKLKQHVYDVVVIGGGAAGLMAAGRAGELGKDVLLIEKNKQLGEKLSISGGGRCNITNAEKDVRKLLSFYGKAEQFLYSVFSQFDVKKTFSFFEKHSLPLVVQARKRVFPHTEHAPDVVATLEKYVHDNNVQVLTGISVTAIVCKGEKVIEVMCGKHRYVGKQYILATGGVSHPETGSTGDGFRYLQKIGHTAKKHTPTIVPFRTKEKWSKVLAGTSLSFMKITFYTDGKKTFAKKGKVLFTHFGLSGPLILNSASKVADLLQSGRVTAKIDVYPDTDVGTLERRIIATLDINKNKKFKNVLKELIPEGMLKGIVQLLVPHIDIHKRVHSVTKEERKFFVQILKALPLTVEGLMGFDRAVVADGGVPLEEIDMRTMRSRTIENLYIIGDLLDINRPSGGFSLQLCWSTGFVAGTHAAEGTR